MEEPGKLDRPQSVRGPEPVGEKPAKPPESDEEGRRPTPVRMAMEGAEADPAAETVHRRTILDPEHGEEWIVTVVGWSASGILPLRTVSLLELNFSRGGDPQVPVRRALCPGQGLEEFSDDRMLQIFQASEPYSPPMREDQGGDQGRPRRRRNRPHSQD